MVSGKNIQPIYGSKTYKIQTLFMVKFILAAHIVNIPVFSNSTCGHELQARANWRIVSMTFSLTIWYF